MCGKLGRGREGYWSSGESSVEGGGKSWWSSGSSSMRGMVGLAWLLWELWLHSCMVGLLEGCYVSQKLSIGVIMVIIMGTIIC